YEGAIQIQGFSNGQNNVNEDWLISPRFDLTTTTYPVLSFWSKTADIGNSLQLKVSLDYPGAGNPNNYTWTTINGNFPEAGTNAWALSDNISLSNFKSAHVYFAFVYTSTSSGAAQWSLDNIILKNLYSSPPPSLNLRTNKLNFGYVDPTMDSIKEIHFTPNYLLSDITIQASGGFLLSKDGIQFSTSVTYSKASSDNQTQNLFVKFKPTTPYKDYTGVIAFNSSGISQTEVNLVATSLNEALILKIVNWNIEWFGIDNTSFGPVNKDLQETNIKTITKNIAADIFAFVEVVSEPRLQNVVNNLNNEFGAGTYAYVICDYGSYSNPYNRGSRPLDELQKAAFVYKTSVVHPIETPKAIVTEGPNTAIDTKSPAYSYFSSGRYPFMLYANVTLGNITKPVRFVLLHAKANTNPVDVSYKRRKNGADTLNYTLNHLYPNDNIILLGDFNDDLDESITYGFSESSYSVFNNDSLNFFSPTLSLSLSKQQSTVAYKEMIDHVELSKGMKPYYLQNSASVITEVSTMVSNYGTTTSDHYPILTKYAFDAGILPVRLISFTVIKQNNSALLYWNTAQEINSKIFEIERSSDNKTWIKIGAEMAAGNSSIERAYSYTDDKPIENINFYRLKQIDNDGKFVYSPIRSISFPIPQSVYISPNPAHDFIKINFEKASAKNILIEVADVFGRTILQKNTQQSSVTIDVKTWAKGIYFIKIKNNEQINTYKIVVQ
ncbi:MAG: T9SS type A sorting domain-containing protein, partial [Ginsengibacter sp.]